MNGSHFNDDLVRSAAFDIMNVDLAVQRILLDLGEMIIGHVVHLEGQVADRAFPAEVSLHAGCSVLGLDRLMIWLILAQLRPSSRPREAMETLSS